MLFRKGRGTKTRAVMAADRDGIYSHAGIAVIRGGKLMVVHITPGERVDGDSVDRIKCETPAEFFGTARAGSGAVYRVCAPAKGNDSTKSAECGARSGLYAGDTCPAGIGCGPAVARYVVAQLELGVEFDHDYDLEDSTKMYCTELVWRAYIAGGVDVTSGKRSELRNFPVYSGVYIFPSDIYKNRDILELIFAF